MFCKIFQRASNSFLDVITDLEEEAHILEWHQRRIKRKISLAQQLKQENEESKRKIKELETKPAHLSEEKIMLIEQVIVIYFLNSIIRLN